MTQNFDSPFELKFLAETGVFEGYASVFHVTDSVNDRIMPGAFRASLARFQGEGRLPPLLWQHDTQEPIGAWREMYEDAHGLFVKGELFVNDLPTAKEAYKLLRENVVTGLSIGYRAQASHVDTKTGARVLTEVDLHEVSLVTFPANEHARVSRLRPMFGGQVPSERAFETFLRASGLSRSQAKGVVAKGYRALLQAGDDDAAAAHRLAARMQAAAAEMKGADQAAIDRLTQRVWRAAMEAKTGYNPNQPRVPAGNEDGGQWTDGMPNHTGRYLNTRKPKPLKIITEVATNQNATYSLDTAPIGVGISLREESYDPLYQSLPEELSTSAHGVEFIAEHEGFRRHEYVDLAGYATIGYGHKIKNNEDYPEGLTDEEAFSLFNKDLMIAEDAIRSYVKVPINQYQFDALTSFVYNVGTSAFKGSTLLRLLNEEKYNASASELLKWDKITDPKTGLKVPYKGLSNRRKQEYELFIREVY